jgi:hypothetical protein
VCCSYCQFITSPGASGSGQAQLCQRRLIHQLKLQPASAGQKMLLASSPLQRHLRDYGVRVRVFAEVELARAERCLSWPRAPWDDPTTTQPIGSRHLPQSCFGGCGTDSGAFFSAASPTRTADTGNSTGRVPGVSREHLIPSTTLSGKISAKSSLSLQSSVRDNYHYHESSSSGVDYSSSARTKDRRRCVPNETRPLA